MHARIGWQGLKTSEFLETGDYYLITGTDFENGYVNLGKAHYIDKSRYDMDQKLKLKNGDILITKDGTIGKVAYLENLDKPGTLNAGVFIVRPIKKSVYKQYLFQYLAAPFLLKYAKSHSTGGTIQHLNQGIIKNFPVALPSTEEQLVISKFLKSISKTITLHEEKQRQLEQLKKALLQKMFADETGYPALRFKNFTEKWEQRKFSDIYKKSSEKNDLSFSKDKVISVANNKWGTAPKNSTDKYMRTYYVYRIGDIAFEGNKSKKFKFGRFVENTLANGIVSHVFDIYRPTQKEHDLWFWKYYIHNENIMRDVLRKSTTKATMMTNLVNKDLLKQKLNIPSIEEQEKIGNYLSKLDHLITLHQHKIDNLKRLKRALLQKMFV